MSITTAMTPDAREDRLPRWAQDTIKSLRRQVDSERRRADEARRSGGPADSDVVLDPYDDQPVLLGRGTRVRFWLTDDRDGRNARQDYVDVQVERDVPRVGTQLRLMAGGSLLVRPHVTNVLSVAVE